MKPETPDVRRRNRSGGREDEHAIRLHQNPKLIEHNLRIGETFQVDEGQPRLGSRSQMPPHHRPGVRRDHLESFFDQLCPDERSGLPLNAEKHDIRRLHAIHSFAMDSPEVTIADA